ncbi:hypothetical protein LWI28_013136 [Acer negundo]|uniref:Uncharacterized protein n=1 Tax=Acer negundo TaxID=4023 RepID=A0AAD5J5M0_ACENE|nr:hypothetical protein LWI28_013136 [Acer negundo]
MERNLQGSDVLSVNVAANNGSFHKSGLDSGYNNGNNQNYYQKNNTSNMRSRGGIQSGNRGGGGRNFRGITKTQVQLTNHCTPSASNIQNRADYNGSDQIYMGDGTGLNIASVGVLPAELSNLKQLQVLDLSHNMLKGRVSQVLSSLKMIQSLNVSSNSFSGDLLELGGFPNLLVFNVSNNSFTGMLNSQIWSASNGTEIRDS